jgi:hypothetical protein
MRKTSVLILFILLMVFISGCESFPYVVEIMTKTPAADATSVPEATATLTIVPTATLIELPEVATATPAPVERDPEDEEGSFPSFFVLQPGNPIYLANFTDPEAGCDWSGVAGQVFGVDGAALQGLTVVVGHGLAEDDDVLSTLTGLAQAYGPGGYEIVFSDQPVETSETYWVQVFDNDGMPLTEMMGFDTYEDCERNLVLMNFVAQEGDAAVDGELMPPLEAYP